MQRFLGLSQEEIMENERLWREENQDISGNEEAAAAELRGAGITPGGIQDELAPPEEGMEGEEDGVMAPTVSTPATGASGVPAPAAPTA